MAKVSVLMPHPELRELALSLIAQYPRVTPIAVEYVETAGISARAQALEAAGCDLIVARGLQARIARDSVRIPIVEMRASTQDLASQVLEMKRAMAPEEGLPRIGIIGFFNAFHSTERLGEILDVDLRVYMATDTEQYPFLVDRAASEGCQALIGGEVVCRRAGQLGLTYRFLTMGEESVREAFEAASVLGYSIDLLKRSNAEMNAMLDNLTTGVFQVNAEGVVQRANRPCYSLLGLEPEDILGRKAEEAVPCLPGEDFRRALKRGAELDAVVLNVENNTVLMNMTPVMYEDRVEGAICAFQDGGRIIQMDSRLRQELAQRGQVAVHTFAELETSNPAFQRLLDQARTLSHASACVLLEGEGGAGKGILAQCMHNESAQRGGAFVEVDASAWHPDDLDGMLFGSFSSRPSSRTMVEQAVDGTLYITHVEALSPELQYKLLRLTKGQFLHNGRGEAEAVSLRLILSTEADLPALMREGRFRRDLYYAVSAMKLTLPPLRERREDIPFWFRRILGDCQKQSRRFLTLTREARAWAARQDWPGNLDQLYGLCRRLVLLSEQRTLTEEILSRELRAMEEEPASPASPRDPETWRDPQAVALMELLRKNRGNRGRTAQELGISTTTLWRRMKRLGITAELEWEN